MSGFCAKRTRTKRREHIYLQDEVEQGVCREPVQSYRRAVKNGGDSYER